MDLMKFVTKEVSDTHTAYLIEGDDKWWVKVRALNARERREREEMAIVEEREVPLDADALEEFQNSKVAKTALSMKVARIKTYEYDKCILDFNLPYLPKDKNAPVEFRMTERGHKDSKRFLENIPQPLVKFIDDAIGKVNKDGKFAEEAEAVKNA